MARKRGAHAESCRNAGQRRQENGQSGGIGGFRAGETAGPAGEFRWSGTALDGAAGVAQVIAMTGRSRCRKPLETERRVR